MHRRVDPGPDLLALAALQDGVVSREQALGHGLPVASVTRLLASGRWRPLTRGIYHVGPVGSAEPTWRANAWAGVLMGGDRARLGGLAAARLHGLLDREPDDILVLIRNDARRLSRDGWTFRRERPGSRDPRSPGNPPRLPVEDTVLDLCDPRLESTGETPAHWVTRAVQRHLTTPPRLLAALQRRTAFPQRRLLTEMLGDVAVGAESPLELRYLRDVEQAHNLPRGERQSPRSTAGLETRSRAYRDVFYEEYALVVELDGRTGHVGEGRLRDLHRDNVTTLRGERSLRYGWRDVVDDGCLVARQVARALILGGWSGSLRRCAHCAAVPDLVGVESSYA